MKKISKERIEKFSEMINGIDKITKNEYIEMFLEHFLGNNFKSSSFEDDQFKKYWNVKIDSVSLCEPEIQFFHDILNLDNNNFIEDCIDVYNNTNNLSNCQLGFEIIQILTTSKTITIE